MDQLIPKDKNPQNKNKLEDLQARARDFCAAQLLTANRDIYRLTLFAKTEQRQVLQAVFLLICEIEKIATITQEPAMASIRLKWWYDSVQNILDKTAPHDTTTLLIVALRRAHDKGHINVPALLDLIDLMQAEIHHNMPLNNNELDDYITKKSQVFLQSTNKENNLLSIYYDLFSINKIKKEDQKIVKKQNLDKFERKCIAYINIINKKGAPHKRYTLTPFDLLKLYFS